MYETLNHRNKHIKIITKKKNHYFIRDKDMCTMG